MTWKNKFQTREVLRLKETTFQVAEVGNVLVLYPIVGEDLKRMSKLSGGYVSRQQLRAEKRKDEKRKSKTREQ
jgi:hypothetical protein